MTSFVNAFNGSKIAWGLSTIGMQLGARFVVGDLTEMQTRILASKAAKRIIMCGMIFVATRDILISVVLTVAIHAVLSWLVNENSGMCIVPSSMQSSRNDVSKEQFDAALAVVHRYQSQFPQGPHRRTRARPPRLFHPMRTNTFA